MKLNGEIESKEIGQTLIARAASQRRLQLEKCR